mmetsp:Transcript_34271/g.80862  ORF Transcript_34271/g.80862 Transcript_34271/m.80862 type:complete len:698 (+) Transcript_34271:68-2161(+)
MADLWDEDAPAEPTLRVNKDYAHRFEDRKRKQELDRLRQQYGDAPLEDDSDDSEAGVEEDDDGEQLTREVDVQIFRTIDAIRTRDPSIRDPSKHFFDELPEKKAAVAKPAAEKKATVAKYMLSGAHSDSDEDDEAVAGKKQAATGGAAAQDDDDDEAVPYVEEQRRLKKAFLSAFDGKEEGDGDNLLATRVRTADEKVSEEEEYAGWLRKQLANDKSKPVDERVTLRRYLDDPDAKLTQDERFLREYVTKQLWRAPDEGAGESDDERDPRGGRPSALVDGPRPPPGPGGRAAPARQLAAHGNEGEEGDDEAFDDREADFERKMNFRFEEKGADRVAANPRRVADSVRRDPKKELRKGAEEARAVRKAEQLEEKKHELQRLKALKRDEILSRLEKIKKVSGGADAGQFDVDEDFDPAKWDSQMGAMFNDEYYAKAAEDPAFAEMIARAEAEDGDAYEEGYEEEGYAADVLGDEAEEEEAQQQMAKGGFEHKVKQMADRIAESGGVRPDVRAMLDEYYGLEYEDLLAGEIPTRFRYREVEPRSFGLGDEELLHSSDRELNKKVPLGWVKRPYAAHYATMPAKDEQGYRPKPPSAKDPAPPKHTKSALPKKEGERRANGGGDSEGKKKRKEREGPSDAAGAAEVSAEPSKKQARKKLLRDKKKAASGVPELPAERLAAYSKLKVKKKKDKDRGPKKEGRD